MEYTEIITAISQVGFPVVCCYLLLTKGFKKIDEVTDALNKLQQTILYNYSMNNGTRLKIRRRRN